MKNNKWKDDIERRKLLAEVQVEAQRLVLKNLTDFVGKENATSPSAMKWAKRLTHKQVDGIINELMCHHQSCVSGINRLEYWKELKLFINEA